MTIGSRFDPSLYAIVDQATLRSATAPSLVEEAIAGGVTLLQVRAKGLDDAGYLDYARAVAAAASRHGVPVLVNDRVDIALAVRADGVHLGEGDLPPALARRLMGPRAVIGATAHSLEQVLEAERAGADYIGFGSIYRSPSKQVVAIQGTEGIREASRLTGLPIVAIGGITVERAAEVIGAGADGVAVISGLWSAPDVAARAAQYADAIARGRAGG